MTKKESSTMLGYEDKLWLAADKLRGSMDSSEYKHVALGLIFAICVTPSMIELPLI